MAKKLLTIDFNIFFEHNNHFNIELYNQVFNNRFFNKLRSIKKVYFIEEQKEIINIINYKDTVINIDRYSDLNNFVFMVDNKNWASYCMSKDINYLWLNSFKFDKLVDYLVIANYKKCKYFYTLKEKCSKIFSLSIIPMNDYVKIKNKGTKYCICSLLSSDYYLKGLIGLYYTVRKSSMNDFIVICTNNISKSTIEKLDYYGIEYIIKEDLSKGKTSTKDDKNTYMMTVINKIYTASLYNYEKVLFLDADCIVCRPLDELFDTELDDFKATKTILLPKNIEFYISNLFLIKPSKENFNKLLEIINRLEDWTEYPPDGYCFEKAFGMNILNIPQNIIIYHNSYVPKYWDNVNDIFEYIEKFLQYSYEFNLCASFESMNSIKW